MRAIPDIVLDWWEAGYSLAWMVRQLDRLHDRRFQAESIRKYIDRARAEGDHRAIPRRPGPPRREPPVSSTIRNGRMGF